MFTDATRSFAVFHGTKIASSHIRPDRMSGLDQELQMFFGGTVSVLEAL